MPEISRFYGIVIFMYYNDHNPPHFHAKYGDDQAIFSISDMSIIEGSLPRRAVEMINEWGRMNKGQLMKNWENARNELAINKIDPLK